MDDGTGAMEMTSSDEVDEIQRAWARERPGTPVSSIGVLTRIWHIAKLLDDDRRTTMLRLGMDASTRTLLSTLRRSGPPYRLSAGELAKRCRVSAGAISQQSARAERDGHVRRVKSTSDRRGVYVELTETGHDLIERTVGDLLEHEETLVSALSPAQREQLAGLLRVLLADLDRRARR
ncbi:MarR family winged helix-turn-helix transcriptional regulator [Amycolatopsis benzoatilytica]|uniref:MarR family winged helix-turn-helix transcriptional regulator n=1 Tax=Amycolatopsis benzoatilytica TaxID=346045 RepID=UPI000361AC7C|nr:MarR family transcriptional regulator [Amycolatopsis benzoatilytica]